VELLPPPPPGTATPELDLVNDPHPNTAADLGVLAQYQRTTGQMPPPAVFDLLQLRRSGAPTEKLIAFVDTHFDGLLAVDLRQAMRTPIAPPQQPLQPSPDAGRRPFGDGKGPFEYGQQIGAQFDPVPPVRPEPAPR
jgi:hypothetical protein